MIKCSSQDQLGLYRRKLLRYNRLLYATAIIGFANPVAHAAETQFTGNTDSDWSNASNWSNGVPNGGVQAVVESNATTDADVTLAAKMFIGKNAAGTLTISNAAFTVNHDTVVANGSSSTGTINIINGSLSNPGRLIELGRSGVGNIVVDEGAISANKYFLGRNTNGDGSLHIKSGTVTIASEIRVATGGNSKGKIKLDQGEITVPNLIFGYANGSAGSLELNGGTITVGSLSLGRVPSSSVSLALNGGVLQIDTLAHVGGDSENIDIAGGILRLKQSNRGLFDSLLSSNTLDWTPGHLVAGYEPSSANETIENEQGTLYVRNDEDGYFSIWSTTPASNNAPVFTSSPIVADYAEFEQAYSATLAGAATDADDDIITYAITAGPSWLTIADDGVLTGTPSASDDGANNFTVTASDGNGGSATTRLKLWVSGEFSELSFDDFQDGWGNWLDGGEDAQLAKTYAIERRAARGSNRRSMHPHSRSFNEQGINLQDSSGEASATTLANVIDLSGYDELKVDFTYLPILYRDNDSFMLRYSSDGGENWQTIKTFVNDIDFSNGIREVVEVIFDRSEIAFTDNALLRFQSAANGNSADVYLDSIKVSTRATVDRNNEPAFVSDIITGNGVGESIEYSGSLTSVASDVDGDRLAFSKLSGPQWLVISADGSLGGTPTGADIGANNFTVQVDDGNGGIASTSLTIDVAATFALTSFDDFDTGYSDWEAGIDTRFGNWVDGGTHARIASSNCVVKNCANIQASGEEATITLEQGLDLTDFNSIKVAFSMTSRGMTATTDGFFIEHSIDGGINWRTIQTLRQGTDFTNEVPASFAFIYTDAEIEFNDNALIRFRADGYGSGDDIYLDNISTSVAYINYLPVFTSNPITLANAARNWEYSGSLADLVSDRNGDPLTLSKVAGPDWLVVDTEGNLSGMPSMADVGANSFTIQANDGVGGVRDVTVNISVDLSLSPSFDREQLSKDNAVVGTSYHASITTDATDPDGDPLSFAKVDGPSWLSVAADGTLSGIPSTEDIGINTFTFIADDGFGGTGTATLSIYVGAASGGYPQYTQAPTSDEWALSFALTGSDKAPDADLDGDNLDNFHEYAYGGDPLSSNNEHLVHDIQISGNAFIVSHTRLRNAKSLGINYQFQVAADASNPHWLDVTPDDINVELLNDAYELVTYSGVLPFAHRASGIGRLMTTRTGPFANQASEGASAELDLNAHITTKSGNIYEDWFGYAAPQGIVDNNSPWMHVRIPFPGDPSWSKDRGTRLYHYKLSQDPSFSSNVITETPKRWSFFNPSSKLAQGTWYWTAGHSTVNDPENIKWLTDIYQFEINGSEEQYVPPSADDVWAIAQSKTGPKLLMGENDFATLLDIPTHSTDTATDQATSDVVIAQADKLIAQGVTNAEGKAQADTVAQLVFAYAASGDTIYRDAAIAGYPNVTTQQDNIDASGACTGSGFGIRTYVGMSVAFLDLMADELSPEMEADIVANMLQWAKCTPEGWIHTMLDRYEHVNYESHVVQKVIHTLIFAGLAIGDRHPEGEEMFKYAYELWLYKGPHGGRSDGSWHNGFGYMSVNEDQLAATPWILGQLTGFDYMMHPWYRNNAKATSYLRAYGNPGQYFGDKAADGYGITTGGPAADISSLHLYTHPENRWMHWQTQHATGNSLLNKVKKVADQWQRWLNLPLRKHYVEPAPISVQTPLATANAYRDVGYVAAHSDITNAANNFMTTMRSSPFSSDHKSHASQNAFTTAYGGKPLFYRTGWRKQGDIDDYRLSKAFNLIMPNDVSQKRKDKSAYAYLPRFAHGDRMSYWIGDASNTYPDATGINRFRRHMVHLKPNILVIYDEVDSTEAATTWTYTLGAHNEINAQNGNLISVHNTLGLATANLYSRAPLTTSVLATTAPRKPTHWNMRAVTTEQSPSVRFLNVIELTPSTDINEVVAALPASGTDLKTIDAGDYEVIAQLDPSQPARLEVRSSDGNVALLYGEGFNTLSVGAETVLKGRYESSTLFMEKNTPRGDIVEELVDQLPDSVTYSNKY